MRPRILGVLLDRAAATLAALPTVEPPGDLRMADFAHFLAAHDHAHGTDALGAYRALVEAAFGEALDTDPVARVVIDFMTERDRDTAPPSGSGCARRSSNVTGTAA